MKKINYYLKSLYEFSNPTNYEWRWSEGESESMFYVILGNDNAKKIIDSIDKEAKKALKEEQDREPKTKPTSELKGHTLIYDGKRDNFIFEASMSLSHRMHVIFVECTFTRNGKILHLDSSIDG